MEFKVGDKVIYLGTKERRTDSNWGTYFGQYGIKKGSKGVVNSSSGSDNIFVENDGRPNTDGKLWACDLELEKDYKPSNPKVPTHLVVWEEDKDPCEFFESEQEAKDFVKELSEKDNVKKDSILLVEIKSVRKVTIRKSLTFAQHKI